jgi:hypothetical protein
MKKDSTSRENIDASSKRTTEKRLIQDSEESQVFQIEKREKIQKKIRIVLNLISGSCNNPERKLDPTPFTLGSQNCFGDAASYSMSQHPATPRPL